jgi:hypothetical protein
MSGSSTSVSPTPRTTRRVKQSKKQPSSQSTPRSPEPTPTEDAPKSVKFCFGVFGNSGVCNKEEKGESCEFSHDVELYKQSRGLKNCPNNCGNFCKETSKQCGKCVSYFLEEKRQRFADQPCFAFFGRDAACDNKNCPYHHDMKKYMRDKGLKKCPRNCNNLCRETSQQCSSCFQKYGPIVKDDVEFKQCANFFYEYGQEIQCDQKTRFRLCKECWNVQKRYIIRRNNQDDDQEKEVTSN